MTEPIVIDDPGDPRLDDYRGLRDPARRSRVEPEGGFFISEGVFVIERLLGSPLNVRSLLLSPARFERLSDALGGLAAPVFVASRQVMASIVGFDVHRGALASADRPAPPPLEGVLGGAHLVCALEGINDHENLGAIMRSAVALGVEGLVLDPTCADPWYRRSVRVSMGAVFDLPIARADRWPEAIDRVRSAGFRVLAMTTGPRALPIQTVEAGPPTMVMLGAEGPGLSAAAIAAADAEVVVPMTGALDSLNVGHAAAIAFHRLGNADQLPRA